MTARKIQEDEGRALVSSHIFKMPFSCTFYTSDFSFVNFSRGRGEM